MLQIVIVSDNAYFEVGLRNILLKMSPREAPGETSALPFTLRHTEFPAPDIIFRDFMVTINIKDYKNGRNACTAPERDRTIHIPFICKAQEMSEIEEKIRKIILIASNGYNTRTRTDIYKAAGLKRYLQLSATENVIMVLTGQGNDTSEISRLLHRSERTVGAHCRNAIKKMGMENRLEFYKYAAYIAKYGRSDEITLCL
ncbi:LuxR C-terminal-related transcriptional regulator [Siccibacter colletis]|uniref:helix-turn-helix domain-containing protein n=1 Tax=Siccibacter colletis TaxID=1505757 RepID=UPI0028BDC62E|nr:LuxR C-terminal-related transcriptional regulator [Siccibacter colletis]WNN47927.1 LuxR C-terminal-related transcriptional regulator [Siccibacter colletis]